jgi:signal transduction histidine kinase
MSESNPSVGGAGDGKGIMHLPLDAILRDCGDTGALMRSLDWSTTPLGPPAGWPQSLRTSVSIVLASRFPLSICWGPAYVLLYNDAHAPILGRKHPQAMGRPVLEVWAEIKDIIGPMLDDVVQTGRATWSADRMLPLERHGFLEECYFTWSYSPILVESGVVGGVLTVATETTERYVGERRQRALRALGEAGAGAQRLDAVSPAMVGALDQADVPFSLIYRADAGASHAELVAAAGLTGGPAAPERVELGAGGAWPLADAEQQRAPLLVTDIRSRFGPVTCGPWPEPTHTAVVHPLAQLIAEPRRFWLVTGVSPRRPLDEAYRGFLDLVAKQVMASISAALAYEQSQRRAEQLAEIDRAKTAFFSNVSHEFRTPLTLMLGPTEDALASPQQALQGANLETVHRNQLRLLKLVNMLLDFSRIEAGRLEATYQPTELAALTMDLASTFRSAIERAGLRFEVDCASLPALVYVDHHMWEEIVLNLLSNALKFTFEGMIRVALRAASDHVELDVVDTGVGIPEDQLPRMFERFHRIEGTRSRTHEGSGIGLALVNDLVTLHGGTVRVSSRLGRGSTFTVSIPLGTAHLPSDRIRPAHDLAGATSAAEPYVMEALRWVGVESSPASVPGASGGLAVPPARGSARVLVADDNADMREYLSRLLGEYWTVEAVADGVRALAAAQAERPDLVLTDVMMPNLDGAGLLAALRADPKTAAIPVIMLSGRAGEESRIHGLSAGADDYLVKPFSTRELLARVAAHLELGRLRRVAEFERARMYSLFTQVPAAVAMFSGPAHHVRFANPRYWEICGRSRAELMNKPLSEVFPEFIGSPLLSIIDTVYATGQTFRNPSFQAQWDQGKSGQLVTRFFDWTCQAVRDAEGRIEGTIQFFFDVTERVRAQGALDEAREAAEAANRAKDEFLAMLGHELRNPLAPIVTAVYLLRLQGGNGRELDVIDRQVGYLTRLVDDLLDVSRITRGKVELKQEMIELSDVVARALETVSPLLELRLHPVLVEVPARGLVVHGDPGRLVQVVANLLTNASKYSEPSSPITITARALEERVELRVKDEGIGIPADQLERIFEIFVQQPQATDRAQGGLGLGLALVRSLVKLHGGSVRAASEGPGKGSEFIVELPRADVVARTDAERPAVRAGAGQQEPCRVLVVDDNFDGAQLLLMALETFGYDVRIAHDGPTALAIAAEFRPAIVLLDIGLPVMDGYEVARRLRAEPFGADARIIAITGYGQDSDRQRSREAGFVDHIVKPVDLASLQKILGEHARAASTS